MLHTVKVKFNRFEPSEREAHGQSWRQKEATIRQKSILFEWNLLPNSYLTRGEAFDLIKEVLKGRRR